jgi:hypothetical protein
LKQFFEEYDQEAPGLFQLETDEMNVSQCSTISQNCTTDAKKLNSTIVDESQVTDQTVCAESTVNEPPNTEQENVTRSGNCGDQQFQYPGHIPPLRYAFLFLAHAECTTEFAY